MFDCCMNIDKLSLMCIGLLLVCICGMLYLMAGQVSKIISIEHKLTIVLKKLDMFANIIHIMSEISQDTFEGDLPKQTEANVSIDDLDVKEIRAVDEDTKPVEAQASVPSGPAISLEEVEATFEGVEELK